MKKKYYDYLGAVAEEWFRGKYNKIMSPDEIDLDIEKIIEDKFFQENIATPIRQKYTTVNELRELFEALSYEFDVPLSNIGSIAFEGRAALLISLQLDSLNMLNNMLLQDFQFQPNHECCFCGKKLPKGVNGNVKFCHSTQKDEKGNLTSCIKKGSNAQKHYQGCCYRNWKSSINTLRQSFKNILKSKKYKTFEEKCEEAKKVLLDFCDLRFLRLIEQMKNDDLSNYDFSKNI